MRQKLHTHIANKIASILDISSAQVLPLLEKPRDPSHGDVALPCFQLAKKLGKSPVHLSAFLAEQFSSDQPASTFDSENDSGHLIDSASSQGPFLNFRFHRAPFLESILNPSLKNPTAQTSRPIIVEYSSPNIAKPFHVGHLRATLIGNCLDRVYRALGYKVISINHLGDWGTQFGYVWAGCELWGKPETPSVSDLVDIYRRATGLKAEQEELASEQAENSANELPEITEMARRFFVDLENSEPYALEFWKWCLEISLAYFKTTYHRLGIAFDYYLGESFYSDKLESVKTEINKHNLLVESQGALGVDLGEVLGFARIYTPDGRSLYLTRDLATAMYRAQTFDFERCIYVVGAPQSLHFRQLIAVLERMGCNYAKRIEHVAFGHVLGMKTRGGGTFIELNDLIDEAIEQALKAYREQVSKRPEGLEEQIIAERVALSALIFGTLSKSRLKDVTFSWKHALEFQGDTGPYLLYAYARINGIQERAKEQGLVLSDNQTIDFSLLADDASYNLALKIEEFNHALQKTSTDNEPNILAEYALDLAKSISKSYNELKVVGASPSIAYARLHLFAVARDRLGQSLRLLGIEPLERM